MTATVLVTGATGFLGKHLLQELLDAGTSVRALVRRQSAALGRMRASDDVTASGSGNGARGWTAAVVEQVQGDLTDAESVRRALDGIEQVYHLAGFVSFDARDQTRMMRVHVDGTRNLLQAAREAGSVRRIVVASTSGVIAVSRDAEFVGTEASPYALEVVRKWPYYLSKIYEERMCLDPGVTDGLEVVCVNPSLLFGPGDDRGSSTDVVLRFLQRRIPTAFSGGLSFVDVRDVAPVFVRAMADGRPGERYLLGAVNWSFDKFFARLSRLTKVPAPRLKLPERFSDLGAKLLEGFARWRGAEVSVTAHEAEMARCFWYLDASKAEGELGFKPRDPQETLLDTVRYLREVFLVEDAVDDWWTEAARR